MSLLVALHLAAHGARTRQLDPEVKDAWGLPAVRITYDYHPDDLATMNWLMTKQVEILEAAGAKKVLTGDRGNRR